MQALLSILDRRGIREARLVASLEKRKSSLYQAMNDYTIASVGSRQINILPELDATSTDGSSPTSDVDHVLLPAESNSLSVGSGAIDLEIGKTSDEKKQKCDRLRSYDKFVWDSFYSTLNATRYSKRSYMESLIHCEGCNDLFWRDEKHCKICHTTFEIDFDLEERYAIHKATCREPEDVGDFPQHKVLSSQLQVLKASIHAIEVVAYSVFVNYNFRRFISLYMLLCFLSTLGKHARSSISKYMEGINSEALGQAASTSIITARTFAGSA